MAERRRSSSQDKPNAAWHVGGEEGHKQATNVRRASTKDQPRHALSDRDNANDQHAAAMSGANSAEFNAQMAKAEKAMLYRMRFEGDYLKKKQRDFNKHSKAEEEKKQMEANEAAVAARIKQDRELAQDQLRRRKMDAQNRKVERSLSSGLAAFKKVKQAQKEAKRYSDTNVLLSEQYSHLNYLVEQKTEQIQDLEAAARLKFRRQQEAAKGHHTHSKHHHHKHKRKTASNIRVRNAIQSGDTVPHMTIHQQTKEVEKHQHVVEHRLRNLGELARELAREKEEIDRLRRALKSSKKNLTTANTTKITLTASLEEQKRSYTRDSDQCETIKATIAELKQQIEDDKGQFGKEWDNRMETLTVYHREATRQVDEIGGQSRSRAKSMSRRKLSHLSTGNFIGMSGLTKEHTSRNHQMVMRKERKAIKTMDEAFQAITRATGIESLEELVDTFVHADRRNYSVVKHITALERDVDELSAELRDMKEMRKRLEHEQHRNGLSRRQKVCFFYIISDCCLLFVVA